MSFGNFKPNNAETVGSFYDKMKIKEKSLDEIKNLLDSAAVRMDILENDKTKNNTGEIISLREKIDELIDELALRSKND